MRKVLEITFAGENYETLLAGNAQEAIEKLRQNQPTLAIVDVNLGDTGGYELCQQIKSDSPSTRVLMLSSKRNPYDAGRGAASGADSHIDKPFDTQALITKVQQMLGSAPDQQLVAAPAVPAPAQAIAPAPPSVSQPALAPPRPSPAALQPVARNPQTAVTVPPAGMPTPPSASAPPTTTTPSVAAAPAISVAPAVGVSRNPPLETKLESLGLNAEQVQGVLALTKEVVEQAVWEVVPAMAETLIKEELARLTAG